MKIRQDFVTNSSSSSFILGFSSEDSIAKELADDKNIYGHFERVYKDVVDAKKMNKEEILKSYKDEIYYGTKWRLSREIANKRGFNWDEIYAFEETVEFAKLLEEELNAQVISLSEDMKDKDIIVEVKYGDECGDGRLEHYVVPSLDCCIRRISHH